MLPVSNISDSIRLLNFGVLERIIWSRHFLILALRRKLLFEEFRSLTSETIARSTQDSAPILR